MGDDEGDKAQLSRRAGLQGHSGPICGPKQPRMGALSASPPHTWLPNALRGLNCTHVSRCRWKALGPFEEPGQKARQLTPQELLVTLMDGSWATRPASHMPRGTGLSYCPQCLPIGTQPPGTPRHPAHLHPSLYCRTPPSRALWGAVLSEPGTLTPQGLLLQKPRVRPSSCWVPLTLSLPHSPHTPDHSRPHHGVSLER